MPELPEVEVLVRHLKPLLRDQVICGVSVRRARVLRPTSEAKLRRALVGSSFVNLTRRGKYLLFTLRPARSRETFPLLGHLGMTGRMYLLPANAALPKHAVVVLRLARGQFVFEDPRYFGRLTLDASAVSALGPEPLDEHFTAHGLRDALRRSHQPLKVKLLDQSLIAGLGNIYASETLFRARLSPRRRADQLSRRPRAGAIGAVTVLLVCRCHHLICDTNGSLSPAASPWRTPWRWCAGIPPRFVKPIHRAWSTISTWIRTT